MPFDVTIIGTSSAAPTADRHPSAQFVNFRGRSFMLDCGEGTQMQCMRLGLKFFRLERIFISHLHPDHYLGLLGVLTTMSLQGRTQDLHIYCPAGLAEIIDIQIHHSDGHLNYNIHYHTLRPDGLQTIFDDNYINIKSVPLKHRLPCWGFIIKEKSPFRKIKKDLLNDLNALPVQAFSALRLGKDYTAPDGRIYSYEAYTEAPDLRSYAYITDTVYLKNVARQLKGVKAIYHEATFLHELKNKADNTFHSTAQEAAMFAKEANAEKLIIGHFSARYKDLTPLLEEAKEIFPETYLGEEGKVYSI